MQKGARDGKDSPHAAYIAKVVPVEACVELFVGAPRNGAKL